MLFSVRPEAMEADYPRPQMLVEPPFLGRWAVLGSYVPDGLIHPYDVTQYLEVPRDGEQLFCCVEEQAAYVLIRNDGGEEFRVNPQRVLWVPEPRFQQGDLVRTLAGTPRTGWVVRRVWHFKDRRFVYFIEIQGKNGVRKPHKRRYMEDQLVLLPSG